MSRRKSSGFNRSMAGGSMPQRNYFCGNWSSAKFNVITFTRGSPNRPRSRPLVFCCTSSRKWSSEIPRALATRGIWISAFATLNVRIEAAGGGGHGVGGNQRIRRQIVVGTIGRRYFA